MIGISLQAEGTNLLKKCDEMFGFVGIYVYLCKILQNP